MMGAKPLAITDTIVVEEGFEVEDLKRIVRSMNEVAEEVGMAIIHGDFKVMPKGKLDGMVITTTGIGVVPAGWMISTLVSEMGTRYSSLDRSEIMERQSHR